MRAAPVDGLGEIDGPEVGFRRRNHIGVCLNANGLRVEQPAHRVVGVRADIGDAAGGRQRRIVPPGEGHRRRPGIMPAVNNSADLAERARVDDFPGPGKDRDVTCPERNVVSEPPVTDRRPHFPGLLHVQPDRLLAEHVLAIFNAGQQFFAVQCIRCADQNEINIGMLNDLSPVVSDERCSVFFTGLLEQVTASRTESHDLRFVRTLANLLAIRRADVTRRSNDSDTQRHDASPLANDRPNLHCSI